MKRIICLCIFCLLLTIGCTNEEFYHFYLNPNQVDSIEIYKCKDTVFMEDHALLITLERDLNSQLIAHLVKIPDKGMPYEPQSNFGLYAIKITYIDGTLEFLGETNSIILSPDGSMHRDYHDFGGKLNEEIEQYIPEGQDYENAEDLLSNHLPANDSEYEDINKWYERYQGK